MKNVLVTGANKGIGLAVVEAILREQVQYKVIMGSRDSHRGSVARDSLLAINEAWSDRVEVLELDVSSNESVSSAREFIADLGSEHASPLYALVNNAGLGSGTLEQVLNVNTYGVQKVCVAMAPMIEPGGRIVNVTSASGPKFVTQCNAARQKFFVDPGINWSRLSSFMEECLRRAPAEFSSLGMDAESPYGLSKACANSYTVYLAKCFPQLFVNACTPGFIETDLGKDFLGDRTPAQAGMKSPAQGARVIMKLLFDSPGGSGHYYGSDSLRSPMDRYRAPGSPEYTGS